MSLRKLAAALALLPLAACSGLPPVPTDHIAQLPLVEAGKTPPAGNEYVLYCPAHRPIPGHLTVNGSLLAAPTEVKSDLTLDRDLYLYKYWASYDRVNWTPSHQLLEVRFSGGFDAAGLKGELKLDRRSAN